jgi:hypothetical protein
MPRTKHSKRKALNPEEMEQHVLDQCLELKDDIKKSSESVQYLLNKLAFETHDETKRLLHYMIATIRKDGTKFEMQLRNLEHPLKKQKKEESISSS